MKHLHRLGSWLVKSGESLRRHADKRELVRRVAARFRAEGIAPGSNVRRAKDIAAEEMTAVYREKHPRCECDGEIHGDRGCVASADMVITRAGARLKVCDRCTLTGDTDRIALEVS